jgi:hypothetical protein
MGAAVGAAAKVGLDAVHAFEDTAKAAINLADATGLSTEQASRWIGVGDDFQVTAEALTMGIGKIGKTLDGAQWDKYGIATHNAAGKAREANDILLDAFVKLSNVTNATQAREGRQRPFRSRLRPARPADRPHPGRVREDARLGRNRSGHH